MKKIYHLFLLTTFLMSCTSTTNVNNSPITSPNPKISASTVTNAETELAKLKIIKHDALNINKDFSISVDKSEMEKLKNQFNCSDVKTPPEFFGGFDINKPLFVCSTFDHTESTVLLIYKKTYITKETDGNYKQYQNLKDLVFPIDTKEKALSFILDSSSYKANNNVTDIKDLLKKYELESGSSYQFLNVRNFQLKDGLKVFVNEVNETSVENDGNDNYKVNMFYYEGNLFEQPSNSCKPILWEVIVQVTKTGEIKELSRTKILEDGEIENCRGPVA